jgi:alcohol dehydrogenase (cytochrome c)
MRASVVLLLAAALCQLCQAQRIDVPAERLVKALDEPQNWLTYWGDYSGIRHRALNQINSANAKDLRLDWIFQVPVGGRFETVPLIVDGVMFLTAPDGWAFALDARTGRQLWSYHYKIPENAQLVNGSINRGFAILGDKLYMTTPEGHLLCLESRTGMLVWNIEVAPWQKGYGTTMAPLAVKDKIIVGVAGGEFGIRGLLDAYSPATGKRLWRFYTIPAKDEPGGDTWLADSWKRGGAPTWMTGTYDPALNTLYWGVGNPGPDLYGKDRLGDNLYSCSMLALDPDTGKLKWHYQFTPHDTHDWDATETPVLVDLPWKGQTRKLLIQANRNAFFYVLDRVTGEFLSATAFARQTWLKEFDAKGRPIPLPNTDASEQGTRLCPGLAGGANWMAPSYNPDLKLFYVPYREQCDIYYAMPVQFTEGKAYWGTALRGVSDEKETGVVKAIDPLTGAGKWQFDFYRAGWGGTLSTSGELLFAGDADGYLVALNSKTGKLLWKIQTGAEIATAPVTFMVQGKQYVTIASGAAVLTFALP